MSIAILVCISCYACLDVVDLTWLFLVDVMDSWVQGVPLSGQFTRSPLGFGSLLVWNCCCGYTGNGAPGCTEAAIRYVLQGSCFQKRRIVLMVYFISTGSCRRTDDMVYSKAYIFLNLAQALCICGCCKCILSCPLE